MKISIALCTYNGEPYLQEQLDSFLAQTYPPYEVVVCDDGSKDQTLEILERFRSTAPFPVRIFPNPTNLGVTKNFERAIDLCTGDIIALSDQDDVWLPHKLAVMHDQLDRHPRAGFVFNNAILTDGKLNPLPQTLWKSIRFNVQEQHQMQSAQAFEVLLKHRVVTGAAMAFRSSFRELVLPIPDNWIHDAWISILLSTTADCVPIAEPLMYYRQHQSNQIGTAVDWNTTVSQSRMRGQAAHLKNAEQHERLLEQTRSLSLLTSDQERKLRDKIVHMRARANLPACRVARTIPVLQEVAARRYERYSSGWYSALRDWLYGS